MADDEIRVTHTDDDPDAMRADIEQTRARMSETIDDIEDVLVHRKEEIQDRLDVMAPVRERPLPSAGIVFGAGLLLGLLTGGGDEHEHEEEHEARHHLRHGRHRHRGHAGRHADHAEQDRGYWQRRAETWESRARRLRDVAQEQEDRLRAVEEEWGEERARMLDRAPHRHRGRSMGGRVQSAMHGVRDSLSEGAAGFISHAIEQFSGRGH
jgi:ElaB/YqjD/DUF883 family membrane-anchored ribosome-binding protein